MTDPRRAERRWLTIASATLRVGSVGGATSAPGGGSAGNPQRPPARPWPPGAAHPEAFPAQAVGAVGGLARWRLAPVRRLIPERWTKSDTVHAPPSESLPLQNAA